MRIFLSLNFKHETLACFPFQRNQFFNSRFKDPHNLKTQREQQPQHHNLLLIQSELLRATVEIKIEMFQPVFHPRATRKASSKVFNCPIKSNYNSTKLFSIIFKSNLSVYILCSARSNPHRRLSLLLHSSSFRELDKQEFKRISFRLVSFRHKYQIWFLCWWYLMRLKGKGESSIWRWKTFNYDIMKHLSPNGVFITFEILIKNKQRAEISRPRFQLIKRLFIRQWSRVSQPTCSDEMINIQFCVNKYFWFFIAKS